MSGQGMFSGKVVVVTGASSGIGRATALGFAREGASLVLVSRDQAALEAVANEAGGPAVVVAADVMAADTPARVVAAAVGQFGGIDVLVNAAGIIGTAATDQTPDELFDRMFAINVRAPFRLMREAFPHIKARQGNVVNVSSVNGPRAASPARGRLLLEQGRPRSPHALRRARLSAARRARMNCVNPGVTVTSLHRRGGMDETRYAAVSSSAQKETHPLDVPAAPRRSPTAVLFVASTRRAG
ncbi:MAG: SDR family NAD(P)-dependent oxidoreductase [Vicinamibacterales bacterium]